MYLMPMNMEYCNQHRTNIQAHLPIVFDSKQSIKTTPYILQISTDKNRRKSFISQTNMHSLQSNKPRLSKYKQLFTLVFSFVILHVVF